MASRNAIVSLHFTDGLTNKASSQAYASVDDSVTLAAILADVATYATDVYAATSGQLRAAMISVQADTGGLSRAPASDSRAYETGVVRFGLVGSTKAWSLAIPTLADAVLTGKTWPLTETNLAALLTAISTGLTHLTFESNEGTVLGAAQKAFFSVRKHRKQLHG